jgi:hypothetical protein
MLWIWNLFYELSQNCEKRILFRSVCLSIRPSVCPQGTTQLSLEGFLWNLIFRIFRKSVGKIQVWLKPDKDNGTLLKDLCIFMIISRQIFLRMRNVSDRICRESQTTHFKFNNIFSGNRAVYEIMWENCGRAGKVTDDKLYGVCALHAGYLRLQTHTLRIWILIAFRRQQCLCERSSIWRCNIASVVRCCYVVFCWMFPRVLVKFSGLVDCEILNWHLKLF